MVIQYDIISCLKLHGSHISSFTSVFKYVSLETQDATVPIAKICGPGMSMPIPATTVATWFDNL